MLVHAAKSVLKSSLDQGAYFWGPHRAKSQHPRLWILTYHRVLPKSDPRYALEEPGMVVEPETFAMHMDLVQKHLTIVSLQDWLQRRDSGQALPPKSCAITFDDGWLDNYQYAFPILQDKGIPATVFVVTHMIGTNATFWPNRLAHVLEQKPNAIETFPLERDKGELPLNGNSSRETLSQIIAYLKQYPDDYIHRWLDDVDSTPPTSRSLMDWDELRTMADTGLVDVGSHSCHHYRLQSDLAAEVIAKEVSDSKHKLEEELQRPAQVFCYPNGDSSPLARELVANNYRAAVTTQGGINSASKLRPFELLRISIHEDRCKTAPKLSSRLANWY